MHAAEISLPHLIVHFLRRGSPCFPGSRATYSHRTNPVAADPDTITTYARLTAANEEGPSEALQVLQSRLPAPAPLSANEVDALENANISERSFSTAISHRGAGLHAVCLGLRIVVCAPDP